MTAPSGITDPNLANNTAVASAAITNVADLQITNTDNVGATVAAGATETYTVTVTNAGPSNVTGAIDHRCDRDQPDRRDLDRHARPAAPRASPPRQRQYRRHRREHAHRQHDHLPGDRRGRPDRDRHPDRNGHRDRSVGRKRPQYDNNVAADTETITSGSPISADLSVTITDNNAPSQVAITTASGNNYGFGGDIVDHQTTMDELHPGPAMGQYVTIANVNIPTTTTALSRCCQSHKRVLHLCGSAISLRCLVTGSAAASATRLHSTSENSVVTYTIVVAGDPSVGVNRASVVDTLNTPTSFNAAGISWTVTGSGGAHR